MGTLVSPGWPGKQNFDSMALLSVLSADITDNSEGAWVSVTTVTWDARARRSGILRPPELYETLIRNLKINQ